MAFITLRQANVVSSPDATIKNFPLIDSEVDNNFANLNVAISNLANLISASTGNITFTGNFIPSASNVFDIGSPGNVFKDLFLSGNSLHLGQLTLSVVSGNIALNGTQVLSPNSAILADNVVTNTKINADAVTEAKIATNAVTETKIANGSITESKIGTSAVTDSKIATNAVIEAKINASAVTEAKIATNAVTENKISSNAVTEAKIATNAVTENKISSNSVTEAKIATNAVVEAKIAANAVTSSKIAESAIITSKLSNNLSITHSTLNTPFERANVINQAAPSTITYDILNQSVVYFTSNSTSNVTVNFRGNSTTTVDTMLTNTSNTVSAVLILTNGATPYYVNNVQIDGVTIHNATIRGNLFWQGNSLSIGGNPSGIDSYGFTIIKRGSAQYIVLASQTQFASHFS